MQNSGETVLEAMQCVVLKSPHIRWRCWQFPLSSTKLVYEVFPNNLAKSVAMLVAKGEIPEMWWSLIVSSLALFQDEAPVGVNILHLNFLLLKCVLCLRGFVIPLAWFKIQCFSKSTLPDLTISMPMTNVTNSSGLSLWIIPISLPLFFCFYFL